MRDRHLCVVEGGDSAIIEMNAVGEDAVWPQERGEAMEEALVMLLTGEKIVTRILGNVDVDVGFAG